MTNRFKDKIVIVTGAGSGIGETTAIKFANEGASVVVADINPKTGNSVSDHINNNRGKSIFLETNSKSSEPDGSKRSANTVAIRNSLKSEFFLLIILKYIFYL